MNDTQRITMFMTNNIAKQLEDYHYRTKIPKRYIVQFALENYFVLMEGHADEPLPKHELRCDKCRQSSFDIPIRTAQQLHDYCEFTNIRPQHIINKALASYFDLMKWCIDDSNRETFIKPS